MALFPMTKSAGGYAAWLCPENEARLEANCWEGSEKEDQELNRRDGLMSRIEVESRVGLKTLGLCRRERTHDDFEPDRASSPPSALSGRGFWLIGSFCVRKRPGAPVGHVPETNSGRLGERGMDEGTIVMKKWWWSNR
jgi:hypothetical protein